MKTKMIIHKGGWLKLVTAEVEQEELVLMQAASYVQNQHYQIWDFRYSDLRKPSIYGDISDHEVIEIEPEIIPAAREIFNFDFTEEDNKFWWFRNDGILLTGADRPFHLQTGILKSSRYVWSYAAVREKFREAKEFYENLEFNGNWNSIKTNNVDKNPSYYEMKLRLENYVENLNRGR